MGFPGEDHGLMRLVRDFFEAGGRQKKNSGSIKNRSSGKIGNDLLSHFRSTIGAGRLNFSVRNGKRWNPAAIVT